MYYFNPGNGTQFVGKPVHEFSKNQCTAWVSFNGITNPPQILDSYNVSDVVKTGTGIYDLFFTTPMDSTNYSVGGTSQNDNTDAQTHTMEPRVNTFTKDSIGVRTGIHTGSAHNGSRVSVQIFGGKN